MGRRFECIEFSIFTITSTSTPVFEKLAFVSKTILSLLLGLSMVWKPRIEIEKRQDSNTVPRREPTGL